MYLQWYIRLVTTIFQAVMNNLKFIILDYLDVKKPGILHWRRDFFDWSINSPSIWKVMPSKHLTKYRRLQLIAYRLNALTALSHRILESQTKAIHTWRR